MSLEHEILESAADTVVLDGPIFDDDIFDAQILESAADTIILEGQNLEDEIFDDAILDGQILVVGAAETIILQGQNLHDEILDRQNLVGAADTIILEGQLLDDQIREGAADTIILEGQLLNGQILEGAEHQPGTDHILEGQIQIFEGEGHALEDPVLDRRHLSETYRRSTWTGIFMTPPVNLALVQGFILGDQYGIIAKFEYRHLKPRRKLEHLWLLWDIVSETQVVHFVNQKGRLSGCHGTWRLDTSFDTVLEVVFNNCGDDAEEFRTSAFIANLDDTELWQCRSPKVNMRGHINV